MHTQAGVTMGIVHSDVMMDQRHEMEVGYNKRKFPLIALLTQGSLSTAIMPLVCRVEQPSHNFKETGS